MLINIQLGQCTDINLEFTLFGKCITQFVIESVNSLDHQDIFLSKLQFITFIFPGTGLKIKGWKIHLFSCKKICHLLIEEFYI